MHYSDPTHALLAKIAKSLDRLSEIIEKKPQSDGDLLAATLAENVRLKDSIQRMGEEMLVIRMDAAKDPVLRDAIIETYLHSSQKK